MLWNEGTVLGIGPNLCLLLWGDQNSRKWDAKQRLNKKTIATSDHYIAVEPYRDMENRDSWNRISVNKTWSVAWKWNVFGKITESRHTFNVDI